MDGNTTPTARQCRYSECKYVGSIPEMARHIVDDHGVKRTPGQVEMLLIETIAREEKATVREGRRDTMPKKTATKTKTPKAPVVKVTIGKLTMSREKLAEDLRQFDAGTLTGTKLSYFKNHAKEVRAALKTKRR